GKNNPSELGGVLNTLESAVGLAGTGDDSYLSEATMGAFMQTVDTIASQDAAAEEVKTRCREAAEQVMSAMLAGMEPGESAGVDLPTVQGRTINEGLDKLGGAALQAGGGSLTLPSDISEQIRRHRRLRNLEGDETAGLLLTHVNLPPETSALSGVVTAEIIIEGEKMSTFSSPVAVKVPIPDGLGPASVGCLFADGSSWLGTGMVTSRVAA
ncbi:unnamed protein product, partial [Chrysoparadoxa australica]